jgi:hypothetical protein
MNDMVRRTAADANDEAAEQLARRQAGERALPNAANAFAQILNLSWRGSSTRRPASYFEQAQYKDACEEEESGDFDPSPDGEGGYDRTPDASVCREEEEPPCDAEPLPPGFEGQADKGVRAEEEAKGKAEAKEPPHGVEPLSQRQRVRDGIDSIGSAKRSQPPMSDADDRRGHSSQRVGECAAPAPAGEMEAWFKELAQGVGAMRHRSRSFESWSIHLPMDPEVLPDTELRIRASLERMSLRFFTQSPESVRLISEHSPVLQRSLEDTLEMKGQIDIDLE